MQTMSNALTEMNSGGESCFANKWEWAIESLETKVFWDMDYDLDVFEDMPSNESKELKYRYGILDDYFTAVPDDPKRTEALKLLNETWKLCDRVIRQESR